MKTANKQNIYKKKQQQKTLTQHKTRNKQNKQKRLDNVETLELVYYYFSNKILRAQPDHNHDHCKQKKTPVSTKVCKKKV